MERTIVPTSMKMTMTMTMMMLMTITLSLLKAVVAVNIDQLHNMLENPSFEDEFPIRELNPWEGGGLFNHTRDCTQGYHGNCSLRVTDRKMSVNGAMQMVYGLKPGRGYALSGYIRLLNDKPGSFWQPAKASLNFVFLDDPEPPEYIMQSVVDNETVPLEERTSCRRTGDGQKQVALEKPDRSHEISYLLVYRGFLTSQDGWVSINGDINAPMRVFADEVKFTVDGPDTEVGFLLDDLKLVEIPEKKDWLDTALKDTEKYRMSHFDLKFDIPPSVQKEDMDVEVKLKSHEFAFGAKVQPDCLVTDKAVRYNNYLYDVFNWAAIGSYKWKMGQEEAGPKDFSDAEIGTDISLAHDLKVRAHSILWGVTKNVPEWVQQTPANDLEEVVWDHVRYMVDLAKGKVEQWDVQNEYIHGHFYEDKLQKPNFTMDVFKMVRSLDPDVKLYLNDFMGVTTGAQTEDMISNVRRFKSYGAPIDGVGIQGHTKDYVKPDPTMIWHRLDKFKVLPDVEVMMTEFDIGHNDDVMRADWLEDAMRAFFAHPVLRGVILWGYWNIRQRYENKYLAYGDQFKLAEGGVRLACLLKKEWNTHHTFPLSQAPARLQGFHGDYDLIIRKNGVPVQREAFHIASDTTVPISVTDTSEPIEVPPESASLPECISHREQKSLGQYIAYIRPAEVTCVNRKRSDTTGSASVMCNHNEILVGCSGSYFADEKSKGQIRTRRGEMISMVDGDPVCNAYGDKVRGSDFKVTAIARCCVIPALLCHYQQAGPSLFIADAMAEVTCPKSTSALGCASKSASKYPGGIVYRGDKPSSCVGKNGPSLSHLPSTGVMTTGVCCQMKGMNCTAVRSSGYVTPKMDRSEVKCPASIPVMTGCMAEGAGYRAEIRKNAENQDVCVVLGPASAAIAHCCIFLSTRE